MGTSSAAFVCTMTLMTSLARAYQHVSKMPSFSLRACATSAISSSFTAKPKPNTMARGLTLLEDLASRVVLGSAKKAVPAGSQLRRRYTWDLFLGEANGLGAAVLLVNKKSRFSIEDAHTALSIMRDEASARSLSGGGSLQQLLLATRSGIAPVAEAIIRKAQIGPSSNNGAATIMRWERLEGLVEQGSLGTYLASSVFRRMDGSGLPEAPAVPLPEWLLKERYQGVKAKFDLQAPFEPSGDQPEAIDSLTRGLEEGKRHQTLLGATGTGKTFIMANVIQKASLPTLVLAPNKILAAQLTNELRALFPRNAVEYFVSYYDYYMPEAFVPTSDTYIDKEVEINEDIDRMRHSATRSLLERRDVIVVASVSCIYGLGLPDTYVEACIRVVVGQEWTGGWRTLVQHLDQKLFYKPQDNPKSSGTTPRSTYRTTPDKEGGGVIGIGPASDEAVIHISIDAAGVVRRIRVVPGGNDVAQVEEKGAPRGLSAALDAGGAGDMDGSGPWENPSVAEQESSDVESYVIYPAKHHVVGAGQMDNVTRLIAAEMEQQCSHLGREGRVLEAERLRQRTEDDILLLSTSGTCKGIENYSRHLAGRGQGERPETLVDYFPENDWLLIVDESHISLPQLGGMWRADRARKLKLVEHGFRLPSALDNRPLKAAEFWSRVNKSIFVSATPGKLELEFSNPERSPTSYSDVTTSASFDDVQLRTPRTTASSKNTTGRGVDIGWDAIRDLVDAQVVIRPTGITDPPVDIRPSKGQVADLVRECKERGGRGERVLVTTLTKRMAEDLCTFLVEQGVRTVFVHSGVKPMHRLDLLQQLRRGEVDAIVGVNLLREGLNLPEVSLVCVLDADAEGFLRSATALLQTIGRATRHRAGRAVLYADRVTPAMQRALAETDRRRAIQIKHNELNNITPSVASAASVGDSILSSIMRNKDPTFSGRRGRESGRSQHNGLPDEHVASWAEPSLPPDQVQLLFDIVALNGKDRARRGTPSSFVSPADDSASKTAIHTYTNISGSRGTSDGQATALVASEDTLRAIKRLIEQAGSKMASAASTTDFKEAALWRDRRDALLSVMEQLEEATAAAPLGDAQAAEGVGAS